MFTLITVANLARIVNCGEGRVVAWVGCRAGSQRLPNKNTLPFLGNLTLVDIKLAQLVNVPEVDHIVFSSDDEVALSIARRHAANSTKMTVEERVECFKESVKPREQACAEGACGEASCTSSEYMQFIAHRLKQSPFLAQHMLYTPVTAPMFNETAIASQIRTHLSSKAGAVPVTSMSGYFYHKDKPLTFSPTNCVATQSLDAVQWLTWPSMIGKVGYIEASGWFGDNPVKMEFDLATVWEINNEMEFAVAQTLYRKYVIGE